MRRPFLCDSIPLENRNAQGSREKANRKPSLRSGELRLTIPITSATITAPASLRSDP